VPATTHGPSADSRDRSPERGHGGGHTARALSPAKRELAKSPARAAQVQECHRELFASSSELLRQGIQRITGVAAREAVAQVESATGAVVCAFASGALVEVFQLDQNISAAIWNGGEGGPPRTDGSLERRSGD